MQIRVREDQEAIIASLSPEDYEALLDLRSFMQACVAPLSCLRPLPCTFFGWMILLP